MPPPHHTGPPDFQYSIIVLHSIVYVDLNTIVSMLYLAFIIFLSNVIQTFQNLFQYRDFFGPLNANSQHTQPQALESII